MYFYRCIFLLFLRNICRFFLKLTDFCDFRRLNKQKGGYPVKITEDNFIRQMKKGDQSALEFAVKRYGGLIKKISGEILRGYSEDAEECMYETILKIWDHISDFEGTAAAFAGWTAKIARYTALDKLRRIKRLQPTVDIDALPAADMSITDDELFNDFFCELISCLNDGDRELFIRIFWHGESIEEASRRLGKTKGSIYSRISRGRNRIIMSNPQYFKKEN